MGAYANSTTPGGALAVRWSGSTWALQAVPNPTGVAAYLYGVSCPSASECVAGGQTSANHSIVERWSAGKWAIVATPNPTTQSAELTGVSCFSTPHCVAVGNRGLFTGSETPFSVVWNGTTWIAPATPPPRSVTQSWLSSVSCASLTACVAVGGYSVSTVKVGGFAEIWNGTKWTVQLTPAPKGAADSPLTGVSCTTGPVCTAVGTANFITGPGSYALRLKAGTWTVQSTAGAGSGMLAGVSCGGASACEAVGSRPSGPLAEAWNGLTWAVQATPVPAGPNPGLTAVACQSATACVAVGHTAVESGDTAFSMQYS